MQPGKTWCELVSSVELRRESNFPVSDGGDLSLNGATRVPHFPEFHDIKCKKKKQNSTYAFYTCFPFLLLCKTLHLIEL